MCGDAYLYACMCEYCQFKQNSYLAQYFSLIILFPPGIIELYNFNFELRFVFYC